MNEQLMTSEDLARFIVLLSTLISGISIIGFILFVRWSQREKARRQRDIEMGRLMDPDEPS